MLNGAAEEFSRYGVSAGPTGGAADPSLAVAVIGLRPDYTFIGPVLAVEPELYVTGADLDVDLYSVQAQVVDSDGS
jgi:hypothetical protein